MKLARRDPDSIRIDQRLLPICRRAPGLTAGRAEPPLPEGKDGDIGQYEEDEKSAHATNVMTAQAGRQSLNADGATKPARSRAFMINAKRIQFRPKRLLSTALFSLLLRFNFGLFRALHFLDDFV